MASTDNTDNATGVKHHNVKSWNGNGNDDGSLSVIKEEPARPSSKNAEMVDVEKHGVGAKSAHAPAVVLKRKLKSRHLQMIAIGTIRSFFRSVSIREHIR